MRLSTEARTTAILAELRRGGGTAAGLLVRLGWPGREGHQIREILRALDGHAVVGRQMGKRGTTIWEIRP